MFFRDLLKNKTFSLAFWAVLIALILFFLSLLFSMGSYTSLTIFLKTFFSKEVLFSIRLSLFTATIATFVSLLMALPSAYLLSRKRFFLKPVLDTILDMPIVISPIALGAMLLIFFNTRLGQGIENNLLTFTFEVAGIILAQFTIISALAVRLLKSTFDQIDPRFEHVSQSLGCTPFMTFFRISLPLAKNGIIAAIILTWARAVGEFGATVTLAGATRMKTDTLPVAIFLALSQANLEKAITLILSLVLIAGILLFVLRILTARNIL